MGRSTGTEFKETIGEDPSNGTRGCNGHMYLVVTCTWWSHVPGGHMYLVALKGEKYNDGVDERDEGQGPKPREELLVVPFLAKGCAQGWC